MIRSRMRLVFVLSLSFVSHLFFPACVDDRFRASQDQACDAMEREGCYGNGIDRESCNQSLDEFDGEYCQDEQERFWGCIVQDASDVCDADDWKAPCSSFFRVATECTPGTDGDAR